MPISFPISSPISILLTLLSTTLLLSACSRSEPDPPQRTPTSPNPVLNSPNRTTRTANPPQTTTDAPVPTTPRILGLPEGWTLVPSATYSATQRNGEVTLTATGQNPTGGYQTKLFPSPLRIYPPQYMLAHKKPDGLATQAFTPFAAAATFKATDPVTTLIVNDAAGRHEVPVTPAPN